MTTTTRTYNKPYGKYGKIAMPSKEWLAKQLYLLPRSFQSTHIHAELAATVGEKIANALEQKGHRPINKELIRNAQFARMIKRHEGQGSLEGYNGQKTHYSKLSASFLTKHGYLLFANVINKYHKVHELQQSDFHIEDAAFLLASYMTIGHKLKNGTWTHRVVMPRKAFQIQLKKALDAKNYERIKILKTEYKRIKEFTRLVGRKNLETIVTSLGKKNINASSA